MNEELKQLIAQRTAKHEKMKQLLAGAKKEGRSLNSEEQTEYDQLDGEFDNLSADIKRTEKAIQRENDLDQPQKQPLSGAAAGALTGDVRTDNPSDIPVDVKRYSLLRAANALRTGNWDEAEYERECSIAIAEKLGREAQGLFVPYEVQRAVMATTAGTGFADAGAVVATDLRDDLFIESLKADSFVVGAGARVITGLVGDVDIPRSLGGAIFNWVEEGGDATDTDVDLDTVPLRPKTLTGAIPLTRKLMKQASPALEALLYEEIRKGMAIAIDAAVLAGDGASNNPIGILNTTGVNTQTVADATNKVPTHAEIVGFETAVEEDNALNLNPMYVTTPLIKGKTKTTAIDSGSGIMLNQNNEINGYPVKGTTLMPAGKTIFGDFSDVVIGMWGVMDITVDTSTLAASGGTVLRVFQDTDVAVRHPEAFCVTA